MTAASEQYLEDTKLEITSMVFYPQSDNISQGERAAINALKKNDKLNLKKADRGTNTVILDTTQKIEPGLQQLSDNKLYKPLSSPVVPDAARKVKEVVNNLHRAGHVDKMTYKWLNEGQKQPRIPEFYMLTKIHEKIPVGRPIVSGSSGPTDHISSFGDSFLQPIAIEQKSYLKDTTDFITFIENTPMTNNTLLATLDVSSLYTNIPRVEGINIVCRQYESHDESKPPIPVTYLRELMRLILEENSFKFNERHFLQTHGIAMRTKMAVAFSVIYMADFEERLLEASTIKPFVGYTSRRSKDFC